MDFESLPLELLLELHPEVAQVVADQRLRNAGFPADSLLGLSVDEGADDGLGMGGQRKDDPLDNLLHLGDVKVFVHIHPCLVCAEIINLIIAVVSVTAAVVHPVEGDRTGAAVGRNFVRKFLPKLL